MKPFAFTPPPRLIFGEGEAGNLPAHIARYGKDALIVTGGISLEKSGRLQSIRDACHDAGISTHVHKVPGEPSPELIDEAVILYRKRGIGCVVAVGGGSSLDAGKAIAAMLTVNGTVRDYLEGMGSREHPGTRLPLIAVPTTAGTGSEATKNAVISSVGPDGFKRSLRHDAFVPDLAIIDPSLALSIPAATTAHSAFDCITQLIESYIATKASPLTDALALPALESALNTLVPLCTTGLADTGLRGAMALAAFTSGVTLANAGLGLCHGIAGPLGGFFPVPHGIACANIMVPALDYTVRQLRSRDDGVTLVKLARAGRSVGAPEGEPLSMAEHLVRTLEAWTVDLGIPRLGRFGIRDSDVERIAAACDAKNSPVRADADAIASIISSRL